MDAQTRLSRAVTPARRIARVVAYDPTWERDGVDLARSIAAALGPLALRVEHIGSTAIPGMAAKAVFDLQVSVSNLETAAEAFDPALVALGFERWPYETDQVPPGAGDDSRAGWGKRLWARRHHATPDANLHVRVQGAPNERFALLFRDWFRAHPDSVLPYARFKAMLADAVPDHDTYTDIKDPVVELVVGVAERWAADTGWHP